jgi:hypothetical protein
MQKKRRQQIKKSTSRRALDGKRLYLKLWSSTASSKNGGYVAEDKNAGHDELGADLLHDAIPPG